MKRMILLMTVLMALAMCAAPASACSGSILDPCMTGAAPH
jgi:hypothetical protein